MKDASIPFLKIVAMEIPYLWIRTIAGLILFTGTIAFLINFGRMLTRRKVKFADPTLFTSQRNWGQLMAQEKMLGTADGEPGT